jgi:hypothetical protein
MSDSRRTQLSEAHYGAFLSQVATGSAAIAVTLNPASRFVFRGFRLKLNAAATQETLTVTLDNAAGAAYDTVIFSQAMAGVQYIDFKYEGETFKNGDKLLFAWTNTDAKTYGLEILYSSI